MPNFQLRSYQNDGVKFIYSRNSHAALFCEMGVGKSRIALAYCYKVDAQRILIVCPISVIGTWRREIQACDLDWKILILADISIEERAKLLKSTNARIVLCNHESAWREPLNYSIIKWKPDAVIVDESHRMRGYASRQAKFLHS